MRHSRKARKPAKHILPEIINPELDKHRREFLGKPGSKQWREYYEGQKKTKQMLFHLPKSGSAKDSGSTKDSFKEGGAFNVAGPNTDVIVNPDDNTCDVPYGWLVELFESNDMKNLLQFAQKQIEANTITVPDVWIRNTSEYDQETETGDPDKKNQPESDTNDTSNTVSEITNSFDYGDFDVTNILNDVINHPKKKPCKAEHIKIQYIPFFLQVYMQLIVTLRELVKREQTNDIFSELKDKITPGSTSILSGVDSDSLVVNESSSVGASVSDSASVDALQGASDSSVVNASSSASAPSVVSDSAKIRQLLLFNINLLRNMNMYANPMYFDDLYYYYYFLGLDKILPSMDDFFRMGSPPKIEPDIPKNNSKSTVKMRVYKQFPDDDKSPEAQNKNHYGYDIIEERVGANPETNFDLFLNLVQLHPDFNYKIPVIAEKEKTFLFEETPINPNDKKSQKIVTIQVGDDISNKQVISEPGEGETLVGGKGLFGAIYDTIGIQNSGLYSYLEDSPLYRNIDDLLTDETPTYDGNVYLCIYSLDYSCEFDGNGPTPFLKFITTKNGDKWGFPSFHFTSVEPEHNESAFNCEMFNALLKTLEINFCEQIGGDDGLFRPRMENEQLPEKNNSGETTVGETTVGETTVGETTVEKTTVGETTVGETTVEKTTVGETTVGETQDSKISQQSTNEYTNPIQEIPEKPLPVSAQNTETPESSPKPEEPLSVSAQNTETQEPSPKPEEPIIQDQQPPNILQEIDIIKSSKQNCAKIESTLDSIYAGLVLQKIEGTNHIFAFLNYDSLGNIVQTPENKAQMDLIFCRNKDASIYPITDSNQNSKLKWATVDELLFEQKILTEPVDPAIFELFSNNDNLWNIEDSQKNYILFPFVVYGINNAFQTITVDNADEFLLDGKIENYGEDEIADEYDSRYCFTINPSSSLNTIRDDQQHSIPNRFAMFAWKTRYIVTDEQVKSLHSSTKQCAASSHRDTPLRLENHPIPTLSQRDRSFFAEGIDQTLELSKETRMQNTDDAKDSGNQKGGAQENPLKLYDGNSPDETPLKLTFNDDGDNSDHDGEEEDGEEDERIALAKLNFPTIYTITQNEHTNNKPIVVWGILNKEIKQFTKL